MPAASKDCNGNAGGQQGSQRLGFCPFKDTMQIRIHIDAAEMNRVPHHNDSHLLQSWNQIRRQTVAMLESDSLFGPHSRSALGMHRAQHRSGGRRCGHVKHQLIMVAQRLP
jgi:hypothetical protein